MSMDKEKWKDEVMGSLDGMQRVGPGPFLYTRILGKLEAGLVENTRLLPAKQAWALLAGMALLIALNVTALKTGSHNTDTGGAGQGMTNYNPDNTNFNLY
jgi:hypothetical protein